MSTKALLSSRKKTKSVQIGQLSIGNGANIAVQSMTNVPTRNIDQCVDQINHLAKKGCEIIRVAVPTQQDTAAIKEILSQITIPLVADVHFHYARALEAIEAGVHKIRLNPGNIKDEKQVAEVIAACKANNTAIRVGVNQGSIIDHKSGEKPASLPELMAQKLSDYVNIFHENNFDNLTLSAKCHDAATTIAVNRLISEKFDFPLHLGVTHAGTIQTGSIRSAAAIGTLLAEGIGDTIRISLAGDPAAEIEVAWEILTSLKLRHKKGPELIACPTCGRTEVNLLEIVDKVNEALKEIDQPIIVAVMGCVVNGPGEADMADVALCGGRDKAVIYREGKRVATVSDDNAVEALMEQINIFLSKQ